MTAHHSIAEIRISGAPDKAPEDTSQAIPRAPKEELPATKKARLSFHMLRCFQLEHPEDEMILCDRQDCEVIADYLEVAADGTEHHLCAFHTKSHTYTARLAPRYPDPKAPCRRIHII